MTMRIIRILLGAWLLVNMVAAAMAIENWNPCAPSLDYNGVKYNFVIYQPYPVWQVEGGGPMLYAWTDGSFTYWGDWGSFTATAGDPSLGDFPPGISVWGGGSGGPEGVSTNVVIPIRDGSWESVIGVGVSNGTIPIVVILTDAFGPTPQGSQGMVDDTRAIRLRADDTAVHEQEMENWNDLFYQVDLLSLQLQYTDEQSSVERNSILGQIRDLLSGNLQVTINGGVNLSEGSTVSINGDGPTVGVNPLEPLPEQHPFGPDDQSDIRQPLSEASMRNVETLAKYETTKNTAETAPEMGMPSCPATGVFGTRPSLSYPVSFTVPYFDTPIEWDFKLGTDEPVAAVGIARAVAAALLYGVAGVVCANILRSAFAG